MSVVQLGEVRPLVRTKLSDADLQAVIDREEAWLARRIGPLVGERTETLYPTQDDERLWLQRPTDSVVLTEDGEALDADAHRLSFSGTAITRTSGSWTEPVQVIYTPTDEEEVKKAIIELLRLTVTDTGYISERIGQYSYQRSQHQGATRITRNAIVRSLKPVRPFRVTRLLSGVGR